MGRSGNFDWFATPTWAAVPLRRGRAPPILPHSVEVLGLLGTGTIIDEAKLSGPTMRLPHLVLTESGFGLLQSSEDYPAPIYPCMFVIHFFCIFAEVFEIKRG